MNVIITTHRVKDSLIEIYIDSLLKKSTISTKMDYVIGDIVWAKIGKYPFWPSIVCPNPESKTYIKGKKLSMLHVRFCNDNGRRSWTRNVEKYLGKNKLISKYPNHLVTSSIKNSKKMINSWNLAIKEADNLLKLDREARLRAFYKKHLSSDYNDSFEGAANSATDGSLPSKANYIPESPNTDNDNDSDTFESYMVIKFITEYSPVPSTSGSVKRKHEISTSEENYEQEDIKLKKPLKKYSNSHSSSKKIMIAKSSSSSTKSTSKKLQLRKSTTAKSESYPKPDTTESETSSKNKNKK